MSINKNYILWSFISTFIIIGALLIIREGIESKVEENIEIEVFEEIQNNLEPPEIIRAVYLNTNSAGSEKKIAWLIKLADNSSLNAVVVDIKDYSGYIAYNSDVSDADKYKTERTVIEDVEALINRLHENNIYVIARMTVFQDPALVKARPDWAVKNKYTDRPWTDNKGLSWIDPGCRVCWDYYSAIAKDALSRGFDEINFDYIRFPSDGDMSALVYTHSNDNLRRSEVLNEFFKYMRNELGDEKMSADLFGFVTTLKEDFGVGQIIEDAFEYFDFVSPMVYPSHYPPNFLGFLNPAEHPYEVIFHTMKSAGERLTTFKEKTGNTRPQLRPWLQDFNLGADYTQTMVEAEIKALQDALGEDYKGFMLWNAKNVYHESALDK